MHLIPPLFSKNKLIGIPLTRFLYAIFTFPALALSWNAAHAQVLAQSGPIELEASELPQLLEEAQATAALQMGEAPSLRALEDFEAARQIVIQALEARLTTHEALLYGVAVEPTEIAALLGENLGDDPAALEARFGISAQALHAAASHAIFRDALADALASHLSDQVLLTWHDWTHQARDLSIIKIPRVPRSSEIDQAIPEKTAEIKKYYDEHPALFGEPEKVAVQAFTVQPSAPKWNAKAQALAQQVHDAPNPEALCAAQSTKQISCSVETRRLPLSQFSKKTQAAKLSEIQKKRNTFQFAKLGEIFPANARELTDPRVQREAAAAILIEEDDLPFARGQAERAQALLDSCQEACWPEAGTELFQTGNFTRARGRIPKIGLAPEAMAAAFELTPSEPVSEIFTVRQSYIVMKLEERIDAPDFTPEAREQMRETLRPKLVDSWIRARLRGDQTWIDDKALQTAIAAFLETVE